MLFRVQLCIAELSPSARPLLPSPPLELRLQDQDQGVPVRQVLSRPRPRPLHRTVHHLPRRLLPELVPPLLQPLADRQLLQPPQAPVEAVPRPNQFTVNVEGVDGLVRRCVTRKRPALRTTIITLSVSRPLELLVL